MVDPYETIPSPGADAPNPLDGAAPRRPPQADGDLPRWPWMLTAVVVAVMIIVGVVLLSVSTGPPPTLTVTALGFEWDSPPTTLCPTVSFVSPNVPFAVNESSTFNVSWELECEANSSAPLDAFYQITNVSSILGIPFSVVSSNVPVSVEYGSYSWLNVTLRAPTEMWSGQLYLFITANEY